MKRSEIQKQFDAIVDFSGVEKFIDTPLKHYSSGMQVRLAFAVAAFLEPEVLIVDEVLAVGDAEFQKKCLGKMNDIAKVGGRTLLFVSHNLAAVKSLCSKGVVLENGKIKTSGNIETCVFSYLAGDSVFLNKTQFGEKYKLENFSIEEISLNPKGKDAGVVLDEYQEIEFHTFITFHCDTTNLHLTYVLNNEYGETLFTFSHVGSGVLLKKGLNKLTCSFPEGFLNIGTYYLSLYIIKDRRESIFVEKDIAVFTVAEGQRPLGTWMGREPGFIKPKFNWTSV